MFYEKRRTIYYVSNLGSGMVSIIDGDRCSLIKEIEIGLRPHNIIVGENNNVYISSDRNSKITLIHDLFDSSKTWHIPNNGNMQVDDLEQKIYVSDTEEVCIYNLSSGEKVASLTGFSAADCLRLDKDKKMLFVLDILQNEIKVYNTSGFQLIKIYKNVGIGPSYVLIGEGKNVYIANKGIYKGSYNGNISILNIESGDISYIDLQEGSVITALEQSRNLLYAVNCGLHRIEVVDILKKESIAIINTTFPEPQRLRLSPDKKILLVTSRSNNGKGAIDKIDTSNYAILDSFIFEQNNSIPYDIAVVFQFNPQVEEEALIFSNSNDKWRQENGTAILAKKVLSTYQEKKFFPEVLINVPLKEKEIFNIENVVFQQCEMIRETKSRKAIDHRKDYSIVQYDFYIPYYIELKDEQGQKYVVDGRLEGKQKATLYIPTYAEQLGVQFIINSFANLISSPIIINNKLKFEVSVLISTKAIVEEMVIVPHCRDCEDWQRRLEEKRKNND